MAPDKKPLADKSLSQLSNEFGVDMSAYAPRTGSTSEGPRPQEKLVPPDQLGQRSIMDMEPQELAEAMGFTPEKLEKLTDPLTGSMRPDYADGTDINTPINKSPIDAMERFKLSWGNEAGKMQYLAKRFQDVKTDKKGNLVVMDNGLWHRVDPSGLGSGDAWEMTKELFSDMVEMGDVASEVAAGEVGLVKGAMAGGAVGMKFGGSLPAIALGATAGALAGTAGGIALAKKLNTTLGRYYGTYEDTPENEVANLSVESVLNVSGAFLPAGVKATAKGMGTMFKSIAPALEGMTTGTKKMLSGMLGGMTGSGGKSFEYLMNNPQKVGAVLSEFGSGEAAAVGIKTRGIQAVEEIVTQSRAALTKNYGAGLEQIVSKVPGNFVAPVREVVYKVQENIVNTGIASIDKSGNLVLKSQDDILKFQQAGGSVTELGSNPVVYDMLQNYVKELNAFVRMKPLHGKAAARQLVDIEQRLGDLAYRYQTIAHESKFKVAEGLFNGVDNALQSGLDNAINKRLGKASGITQDYNALRRNYRQDLKEIKPLLNAQRESIRQGSNVPYENLYNKLAGTGTGNVLLKGEGLDVAKKLAASNPALAQSIGNLELFANSQRFTPLMREGIVGFGLQGGGGLLLATGNPAGVIAGAGMALTSSPNILAKGTIKAAQGGQASVRAMRDFTNFLRTLPPKELKKLASDEDLMRKLINSTVQASGQAENIDQLMQGTGIEPEEQF